MPEISERDEYSLALARLHGHHGCILDPSEDRKDAHRAAKVEQKIRAVDEMCQRIDQSPPNPLTRNHT